MPEPARERRTHDIPAALLHLVRESGAPRCLPMDEETPEEIVRHGQQLLDDIDEQLLVLLEIRTRQARRYQLSRRAVGLPASETACENATVSRYASSLGRGGGDIGRALLLLSRPPVRPEGDA